jgi:1,2-diacylglycerol 3-alpha-glucosyltransferase
MSVALSVIWIDWYAYHVARLRALVESPSRLGDIQGLELVGGCGVHRGVVFRNGDRGELPIQTLLPATGWSEATQNRMARLVWKKLAELNPQVVLVPGYYTAPALAAAVWARRHNRKAILMTETTRGDHRRMWWKEAVKGRLIRSLFDAAIAGGSRHVEYLQELQFPASRIGRCYDVVDNEFFRKGAAQFRKSQTAAKFQLPDRYLLYVGRLAPEKNLEALIRGFAKAVRRGAKFSLVLVGEGPLRGKLERQVQEAGLEPRVVFAGLKTTAQILPYYAFAHSFVLPSYREPWGLVVNEAMAAGLPVLVSRRCGCSDDLVEHGSNGLLFAADNEEELTAAILRADRWSAQERDSMGRRSENLIAHYSLQHWAEEVFRLVRTLSNADRVAA